MFFEHLRLSYIHKCVTNLKLDINVETRNNYNDLKATVKGFSEVSIRSPCKNHLNPLVTHISKKKKKIIFSEITFDHLFLISDTLIPLGTHKCFKCLVYIIIVIRRNSDERSRFVVALNTSNNVSGNNSEQLARARPAGS